MSRCFDILLANLFGIFAVLSLPLPLVTFDGLPFVGVVQLAGELDIDFRATVNLSFAQEFVQQYAEPFSPQTTLTIKVLHARHPKRNPFLRPFWVLSFYLR